MTWMLRLYPRAWQERYGEEMAAVMESEPRRFRLMLDLLAGVIDARMNPQVSASAASGGKKTVTTFMKLCARTNFTREEKTQSVWWMIGASLVFVGIALVLQLLFEKTLLSQTILYSAYPMALILSGQSTYLKGYSMAVRVVMMIVGVAAMFAFFLAVTYYAEFM
jgi:hypothetical protein